MTQTMMASIIIIVIFGIASCYGDADYIEHNQTMRIELFRRKPPVEQHLNSPLQNHDFTMDWLFKKPHPHPPSNRTNDSIALYRYLDHEFYGKIVIGHPGQTLNVAFDTTWTYSWVLSSYCNGLTMFGCYMHNKYNHQKSSEYKPDGTKFSVGQGKYKFSGFYSYDNISIAHSNVTNYSFIEIVEVPNTFIFYKSDGVIGLGLQADKYEPFFYTLLRQKKIKDPIYSIYIDRDHQSDRGGSILLGGIDKKHIKKTIIDGKKVYDDILYVDVAPTGYWQFPVEKIVLVLSRKEEHMICSGNCTAIVDSSASTIRGPSDAIDKIHYDIQATKLILNRYSVECDRVNKLPPITFIIGGKNFTLQGPSYITKMTWKSLTICLSAFQPAETEDEQSRWVLGAAFMAEVYTVYDIFQKKLGLVRSA